MLSKKICRSLPNEGRTKYLKTQKTITNKSAIVLETCFFYTEVRHHGGHLYSRKKPLFAGKRDWNSKPFIILFWDYVTTKLPCCISLFTFFKSKFKICFCSKLCMHYLYILAKCFSHDNCNNNIQILERNLQYPKVREIWKYPRWKVCNSVVLEVPGKNK